jgi:hypothetical protein
MIVIIEKIIPPMVFLARHLLLRNLSADHLAPAYDFLRLVSTRRTVLDGVVVSAQIDDFLILYGGAFAIPRLLAGWQDQHRKDEQYDQNLFHLQLFFTAKVQNFAFVM